MFDFPARKPRRQYEDYEGNWQLSDMHGAHLTSGRTRDRDFQLGAIGLEEGRHPDETGGPSGRVTCAARMTNAVHPPLTDDLICATRCR